MQTNKGVVKWFNDAKGYGFITSDSNNNNEFFVHFSSIIMNGFRTLKEGQKVFYEIIETPKGKQAYKVKIIE